MEVCKQSLILNKTKNSAIYNIITGMQIVYDEPPAQYPGPNMQIVSVISTISTVAGSIATTIDGICHYLYTAL